jgi:hypothetical protein
MFTKTKTRVVRYYNENKTSLAFLAGGLTMLSCWVLWNHMESKALEGESMNVLFYKNTETGEIVGASIENGPFLRAEPIEVSE